MAGKKVLKLASRGKRFGAACIDAVAPLIFYIVFFSIMSANGIRSNYPYGYGFGNEFGYGYGFGYDYGFNAGSRLGGGSVAALLVISVMLITYVIVEFVFFAKGKSIGKAVLGLQVVSSISGKPFGFWKMMLRECIVKGACGSTFFLGYIWILIDEKNRGWHDKILDSYVVDLKESAKLNKKRAAAARKEDTVPAKAEETDAAMASKVPDVKEVTEVEEAKEVNEVKEVNEINEIKEEPADTGTAAEELTADTADADQSSADRSEEAAEPSDDNEIEIESVVIEDEDMAPAEEAAEEASEKPAVSMSMKKEELLEAARSAGVSVSSRATKADIIEAIEKAYSEVE